jgi:hypothetical protein
MKVKNYNIAIPIKKKTINISKKYPLKKIRFIGRWIHILKELILQLKNKQKK